MKMNKTQNLPESELCFALVALLTNLSIIAIAVGVLWYLISMLSQSLPMMIVMQEIH